MTAINPSHPANFWPTPNSSKFWSKTEHQPLYTPQLTPYNEASNKKLEFLKSFDKPCLKASRSVPDDLLGGFAGRSGKWRNTQRTKTPINPASIIKTALIWLKYNFSCSGVKIYLPSLFATPVSPTSSTKIGPIRNESAPPMNAPAITIAVEIVRWLLGNHVADNSTPPDKGTGATNPLIVCPQHTRVVDINQLLLGGKHLIRAPINWPPAASNTAVRKP